MNRTALDQRLCRLDTRLRWSAISFFIVFILLSCPTQPALSGTSDTVSGQPISWAEIESLLGERKFVSKEELFQLLHQLYSARRDMIRLDKPVIRKLAETIGSLFPLDGCDSIALADGGVTMIFNAPQIVHIPNSWRQASLKISERLVLRLEEGDEKKDPGGTPDPSEKDTRSVRFIIEQGSVQLDFSFLLRIFGSSFRDGQGSELLYRINEHKQVSSLSLIESNPFTRQNFAVSELAPDDDPEAYSWIDIRHPDFPGIKDIGLSDGKLSFMGMDIELLPNEMIRFGNQAPRSDSEAYHFFKAGIDNFEKLLFSKEGPVELDYTRTFGYYFEERRISVNVGFRSSEDQKKNM